MSTVQTYDDNTSLAQAVAKASVAVLKTAIDTSGHATWVWAGGNTPLLSYKIIAAEYADAIDWSKVTALIGDERIGPLDGPDNNWHQIEPLFDDLPLQLLRPLSNKIPDDAARDYSLKLDTLPKCENGMPRLDLVWLGIGPDGHTLSLFPGHVGITPTSDLVIPVHDSPKPPAERITLTLRALQGAKHAIFIATGADKKSAVASATTSARLPAGIVAKIIETHEGTVQWFTDKFAANN